MKFLYILLGWLSLPGLLLAATEVEPGQLYQGGARLSVSQAGIEFSVPEGWLALLPPGAEAMVFEADDQSARMFVMAEPGQDVAAVEASMNESTVLDAGLQIAPGGPATQANGLYRQTYNLLGGNPQGLKVSSLGRLGDNQVAIYTILVQLPGRPEQAPTAEAFMRGIEFSQIAQPATQATPGQVDNIDWNSELRGRSLRYLKSGNGLTTDKRINLCSDGTAVYSDNDSYFSGGAVSNFSAYTNRGDVGRWVIAGNRLSIDWNDGTRSAYGLSRRYVERWSEWGTFLDDERWFNTANKVCQ